MPSASAKDGTMLKAYFMLFLPFVILALNVALFGNINSGLFIYWVGGIEYSFGLMGFTVNQVQAIPEKRFDYPVPTTWPEIIRGIPKLLTAHFALAIVLFVYCTMYGAILGMLSENRRLQNVADDDKASAAGFAIVKPLAGQKAPFIRWVTPPVILLALGISISDVIVTWKCLESDSALVLQAFEATPAVKGLGITAGVLAFIWFLCWAFLLWRAPKSTKVASSKRKTETPAERAKRKKLEAA